MTLSDQKLVAVAPRRPVGAGVADIDDRLAPIERLPKWLLCIPIGVQLFWLGAKYGSVTLPSVLNPAIENGGLVGESKFSYLKRVASAYRDLIADTAIVESGCDPEVVRAQAGIPYPLIAKPDIGWCGYGVRRIAGTDELKAYAADFPPAPFLLQRLAVEPNEAGIHYERRPGEQVGRVAALTIRHPPAVVGDGQRNIGELIATNVRTRTKIEFYRRLLSSEMLVRIPPRHERVVLTTVASVRVGGRYEDAMHLITPALSAAVDGLCRSMQGFEYGRLDVRFGTVEALREGRFKTIEINGAGSEAIQFWDPSLSMSAAFAGVFAKQRDLYAMANVLRGGGRKPVGLHAILKAHFKQQRLIRQYPSSN
jgi:hypothetical protein